ncbi:hypothetical protein H8959_002236 [Pygathrix nigripes]
MFLRARTCCTGAGKGTQIHYGCWGAADPALLLLRDFVYKTFFLKKFVRVDLCGKKKKSAKYYVVPKRHKHKTASSLLPIPPPARRSSVPLLFRWETRKLWIHPALLRFSNWPTSAAAVVTSSVVRPTAVSEGVRSSRAVYEREGLCRNGTSACACWLSGVAQLVLLEFGTPPQLHRDYCGCSRQCCGRRGPSCMVRLPLFMSKHIPFCGVLDHAFMEFLKRPGDYCQGQHDLYEDK